MHRQWVICLIGNYVTKDGAGNAFRYDSLILCICFLCAKCWVSQLSGTSLIFIHNTSVAAPGALANHLQCRTARKANETNLDPPNQNPRSLLYSNMGALINFR